MAVSGKMYTMEELGILRVVAETDFDGDGIDDYYDIMLGRGRMRRGHPRYDGSYVDGGTRRKMLEFVRM